jgi:hypothetical protein
MLRTRRWSSQFESHLSQENSETGVAGGIALQHLAVSASRMDEIRSIRCADVGVGPDDGATGSQPLDLVTNWCKLFPVSSRTVPKCVSDR